MVTDFKETLEVKKNSKCFLSYSFNWTKEDLSTEEGMLPNPPMEIRFGDNLTLDKVETLINDFSENEEQCAAALQTLQNNGKVTMVSEY